MYSLVIQKNVDRILDQLYHKNRKQFDIIINKTEEILNNPYHQYKNLRKPLQDYKQVHIDKNFVLVFSIDYQKGLVTLHHFDHHDYVYDWRPPPE